jgi:uncharacterized protein (TIGR00369 family)
MTRADAGLEGPTRDRFAEALARQDEIFRDSFPGMLGVRITEVGDGSARGELTVDARVVNPGGVAHGGALAGFADTVAAWATFPSLDAGQMFTTVDFKVSFLAAVSPGEIVVGEASVLHRGARTMVVDVRLSVGERLVAVMLATQAILTVADARARY